MTQTMTPALQKVWKAREIQLPPGARAIKHKKTPSVAYLYERNGLLCALAFRNRQTKPCWRYRFPNEAARIDAVTRFFNNAEASAEFREKDAGADNNAFEVGHILTSTWGYSMTLVDFYEVVGKRGKTIVQLREVKSVVVSGEAGYQGNVIPAPGEYAGDMIERRVLGRVGDPGVKISDGQGRATLWDGKPKYFNRMD